MKIEFDDSFAHTFRKRAEVLAFRSQDAIQFRKECGDLELREGGWVIVPLDDAGAPKSDLYGCDGDVFEQTYEVSPSLKPNTFRKKETVRAYQPRHPFSVDTVLEDGFREVEGASSLAEDAWIVQAPNGETYPVENEVFRATYVEVIEKSGRYTVKQRDQHLAADGTPKRILALDGGGVRGILTLGYLERIEKLLRERHGGHESFRLSHYFDLIAGTSTGAIIAALLASGWRVEDIRDLYQSLAADVFSGSLFRWGMLRAKFSPRALGKHLYAQFQDNNMGSSSLETGLLIVAKRLDTGSVWPISNNPASRWWVARKGEDFYANENYLLRRVVRASTAAPTFFKPERIEVSTDAKAARGDFVDGGVSPHNNPALLALQLTTLKGFGIGWPLEPDKLLLVSVGTGSAPPGRSRSPVALLHAGESLLSLMDDCAELVETLLQWMSKSPTARSIDLAMETMKDDLIAGRPLLQYLRYNVALDSELLNEVLGRSPTPKEVKHLRKMDRPSNLSTLLSLGRLAAEQQLEDAHFPAHFDLG